MISLLETILNTNNKKMYNPAVRNKTKKRFRFCMKFKNTISTNPAKMSLNKAIVLMDRLVNLIKKIKVKMAVPNSENTEARLAPRISNSGMSK